MFLACLISEFWDFVSLVVLQKRFLKMSVPQLSGLFNFWLALFFSEQITVRSQEYSVFSFKNFTRTMAELNGKSLNTAYKQQTIATRAPNRNYTLFLKQASNNRAGSRRKISLIISDGNYRRPANIARYYERNFLSGNQGSRHVLTLYVMSCTHTFVN